MTISGSVLALLLVCLRYTILRKMPSTVYYYAWLLVLLRFALPLPGLVPTLPTQAEKADAPAALPAVYSEMNEQENIHEIVQENDKVVPVSGQDNVTEHVLEESKEPSESQIALNKAAETKEMTVTGTAHKASLSFDWKSPVLWLSVWAAGAVISMAVTVFSYLKFSFGLKRSLMEPDSFTKVVYYSIPGKKPALYFSGSARTPMLLGVFKPKIILPLRGYNEELLRNILRHELTHYRRFDMLYKWVSAAILSLHWFNPATWFIRRELNRACEMSCDEMLLRSMNKDEKQSYGNTLLLMAASKALPATVVATTFATEKRNLKERLVQIMNYKKSGIRLLSAVLAIALLTGCGLAAGPVSGKPSENMSPAPDAENGIVKVKTVDEFLAAIAPNTVIELAEGVYDLSKASDYAKNSNSVYYSWEHTDIEEKNTAELVIHAVKNLTIRGAGIGKTTIAAVPRTVNVITFKGCSNTTVSGLTAGHTKGSDYCTGGVLLLENCTDTIIDTCGLYGCGTIGVKGLSCERMSVTNCDIYECSIGAIDVKYCEKVSVSNCDIHDIGVKGEYNAFACFSVDYGSDITINNCKIHDNKTEYLLNTIDAENVYFISNEVTKNRFITSAFYFELKGAKVDGCSFKDNDTNWYKENAHIKAVDIDGNILEADQFTAMKLRDIKPVTAASTATPTPFMKAKEVEPGTEITVKTIDEFLDAIGPDRVIVLDGTNFDQSKSKTYGGIGTEFYSWEDRGDGYGLVIREVNNLTIKAKNPDPSATTLEALSRYADVLSFDNCENVTVEGFTAGHTKEKGECSGGVLEFSNCRKIRVEKMRLYGCGSLGIESWTCSDFDIVNTEIYECSIGGTYFDETSGINFKDCNIHDVPSPAIVFRNCEAMTWNGQMIDNEYLDYDVKPDGTLIPINDM